MNDYNPSMPPKQRPKRPELPKIDTRERGASHGGVDQVMDRRVFFQLLVVTVPAGESATEYQRALADELRAANVPSVIYADANNPRGLGVLTWNEDPAHFVDAVRPIFSKPSLMKLALRPEMTMVGRTYGSGFEPNLAFWLLEKPIQNVLQEGWDWAIWYPLRRIGPFERLPDDEKRRILGEHGTIGRAYGAQDLAHDVRLACHGLDANDNEFVIGLIGKELHPLSHVVQSMRKTRQTSEFIEKMGPFFVGRAVWRHGEAPKAADE